MRADGLTLNCDEDMAWDIIQSHADMLEQAPYDFHVTTGGLLMREFNGSMNYLSCRAHKPYIAFPVCINNIDIRLLTGNEEILGTIPYGDLIVLFEVDLYWWLNAMLSTKARNEDRMMFRRVAGRSNTSKIFHFTAMCPTIKGNLHPYIQSRHESYSAGNTCFGHLQTPIYNALINADWDLFSTLLRQWASTYHMSQTGPLNNINKAIVGVNKYWSAEQKDRLSVDFYHCEDVYKQNYREKPELMGETHCVDCILVDNCRIFDEYIDNTNSQQRKLTLLFMATMRAQFAFGVFIVDEKEDVVMAFDKNVNWEESEQPNYNYLDVFEDYIEAYSTSIGVNPFSTLKPKIKEYLGSLVCREIDYHDYLFFKSQLPRTPEEYDTLGIKLDVEQVSNLKLDGVKQWQSIDLLAQKELIATYKEIYNTNKRRER